MMRILVTGANGFVCSNIIDVLVARGWFVYAADRTFDNPAVAQWSPDAVEKIEGDVELLPPLKVDALLHGAAVTASPSQRDESPEDNLMANLSPALAMLRYADQHAISRAIFVSSSAVYPVTEPGIVADDQAAAPLGTYPVAKYTIERFVDTLRQLYDRDVTAIRLGNVYGLHEYTRPTRPHVSLVQQLVNAGKQGAIDVTAQMAAREWTFAPDIGAAVVALLDASSLNHAVYNVAAAQVHTAQAIAEAIQAALPENPPRIIADDSDAVPVLTRLGTLDNTRLQQDTGFEQWTPLQDGIRLIVDAMRNEEADHA